MASGTRENFKKYKLGVSYPPWSKQGEQVNKDNRPQQNSFAGGNFCKFSQCKALLSTVISVPKFKSSEINF